MGSPRNGRRANVSKISLRLHSNRHQIFSWLSKRTHHNRSRTDFLESAAVYTSEIALRFQRHLRYREIEYWFYWTSLSDSISTSRNTEGLSSHLLAGAAAGSGNCPAYPMPECCRL